MIEAIFVSKKSRQALQQSHAVQVVFGSGITGDRHFKKAQKKGQNITLIEAEAVDAYNAQWGQSISPHQTRRNIITRGVDLNALVGVEFSIGKARFKGVELCQPCNVLGRLLENQQISRTQVIQAFLGSGGLRADVIGSGIVGVGMTLDLSLEASPHTLC
jgi:MOSC domain-containing protein YiiM